MALTLCILAALAAPSGGDAVTATLEPRPVSRWNFATPTEVWSKIGGGIPVPHVRGDRFLAHPDGPDGIFLMVDRDGDGNVDSKVKGVGGYVALRSKTKDGKEVHYGVRFRKAGSDWEYACSSTMSGTVAGLPITLIDIDGNGRWNDYGVDGLILGKGKNAGFLSKVVSLRDELMNLEVSEDGTDVKLTPFEGETGEVEFSIDSRGRLAVATVSDLTGKISFAFEKNGKQVVPVGKYAITGGLLTKGKEQARLATGKMRSVNVQSGKLAKIEIGGSVTADFRYELADGKLTVKPEIHYYGQGGEEYVEWLPDNKSPKITVFDSRKKRPVESGRFASC
ncbi:MAG: hypothetical protein H6832_12720 [Planctomycetes bacterium]|nr:hypothetical protein [Planctomycetota bacterium]MCB9919257.1 hypothetical protein [Planctomycetota bacterium]